MNHSLASQSSLETYVWAALFLIGAIWSGYLYLRTSGVQASTFISSGEAHFVHIVMHLVMALMLFLMTDAVAMNGLIIALGVTGLIIVVALIRDLRRGEAVGPSVIGGTVYHLAALGVMILAMLTMGGDHEVTDLADHHHVAMGHGVAVADNGNLSWRTPVIFLFLLDGVATLVFALFLPRTLLRISGMPRPISRDVRSVRLAVPPHVLMAVGMAAMLAG